MLIVKVLLIVKTSFWKLKIYYKKEKQASEDLIWWKSIYIENQRVINVSKEFGVSIDTLYKIIRNLLVCQPNIFLEVGQISRKIISNQKIISLIEDDIA